MTSEPDTEFDMTDQLRACVEAQDGAAILGLLEPLTISEALRELLELNIAERSLVLSLLPAEYAAELIEEAPAELAAELVEDLETANAVAIMDELDSDTQADLIGDLDEDDAEAILNQMDAGDAADVRRLASYGHDTAGGLMLAEAFTFGETDTVGAVLRRIAADDSDFERYRGQHPYILNEQRQPIGVVSLRGLLTAKKSAKLTQIMAVPITIAVDTRIDELRDIFDDYDFLGFPVVEADGSLAGFLSRSALDFAVLERSEAESLKLQGVVGDELRSMPLLLRSRRRLAWLSANIGLNIIAASVISAYESTLSAVIAIAIFLPMVSDMSGCSGNQAVAVSMRELSLGLVRPVDLLRVWLKEVSLGVINGVILGILIGVVCWFWKGNAALGAVIGTALALNTILAVSIGGVIPLLLKRLNQDPAVASGPLLTTITDMAGFFLVLSLASLAMPLLV